MSESEWLQETIKILPLPSLKKLVFSILTGFKLKEIALSWKEKISENSSEDWSMLGHKTKPLETLKLSSKSEINSVFLPDLHLMTNI